MTEHHNSYYGLWVPAEDEEHAREMQELIYEQCDKVSAVIRIDGKPEDVFVYCDEKKVRTDYD